MFHKLTAGDITRFDEFAILNYAQVLNELSFQKEKSDIEEIRQKKINKMR